MLEIFGAPTSSITGFFSFLEFNGICQNVFYIIFNQKKISQSSYFNPVSEYLQFRIQW